jgi:hypothetical protein
MTKEKLEELYQKAIEIEKPSKGDVKLRFILLCELEANKIAKQFLEQL